MKRTSSGDCTSLSQRMVLRTSDGGSTDLASCHQIDSIVKLFEMCHRALLRKLSGDVGQRESVLLAILNPFKVDLARSLARRQAGSRLNEERGGSFSLGGFDETAFVNVRAPHNQSAETNKNGMMPDYEAEKLIRSYGRKVNEFFPERGQGKRKRGSDNIAKVSSTASGNQTVQAKFSPLESLQQSKGNKKGKGKSHRKRRKSG